jgi:hypothetical protein
MGYSASEERLHCAFALADNPNVAHRKSIINATYAYAVEGNTDLVCEIWKQVRNFSEYFGYQRWKNVSCRYEACDATYGEPQPVIQLTSNNGTLVSQSTFHLSISSTAGNSNRNSNRTSAQALPPPPLLLGMVGSAGSWLASYLAYASGYQTSRTSKFIMGASGSILRCNLNVLLDSRLIEDVLIPTIGDAGSSRQVPRSAIPGCLGIDGGTYRYRKLIFIARSPYSAIATHLLGLNNDSTYAFKAKNVHTWRAAVIRESEKYSRLWSSFLKPLLMSSNNVSSGSRGANVELWLGRVEDLSPVAAAAQVNAKMVDLLKFVGIKNIDAERIDCAKYPTQRAYPPLVYFHKVLHATGRQEIRQADEHRQEMSKLNLNSNLNSAQKLKLNASSKILPSGANLDAIGFKVESGSKDVSCIVARNLLEFASFFGYNFVDLGARCYSVSELVHGKVPTIQFDDLPANRWDSWMAASRLRGQAIQRLSIGGITSNHFVHL